MSLPRGAAFLLKVVVPKDRVEDLLGDLEEVHRDRIERRGRWVAAILTSGEAIEMAAAAGFMRLRFNRVVPVSWIDFKLGTRMLVKYPGLTVVGGLAMAFGIFAGAACFEYYSQILHPTLPFNEGERVVNLSLFDDRYQSREPRVLHDFAVWQTEFSAFQELGAAQPFTANLRTGEGRAEPIRAAAMTASAFRLTRVPPLMGRTLVAADESPRAPETVVLGYDLWQTRFGGAADVIGRSVILGDTEHTIVGVMGPKFGFPVNQDLWVPLRIGSALEPLRGPGVLTFARLAPGTTVGLAQTELDAYVARAEAERPEIYGHLHARVLPYAEGTLNLVGEGDRIAIVGVNLFAFLFLVLVCGNVALLMFARAAAREEEITVRFALGAGRMRIITQLFAEALVLGALAGLLGVGLVGWGLDRFVHAILGGDLPAFWFHASVSPRTVVYAGILTLVAATVAGVVPGLKITSGSVESRLRRKGPGGGGQRFGGLWTALIIVQIAATVTFPVVGWFVRQDAVRIEERELGFASEEYLSLQVRVGQGSPEESVDVPYAVRFSQSVRAFSERLEGEPSVRGVTMTRAFPGTYHGWRRIEMDEGGETPRDEVDLNGVGRWVWGGVVAPDFFDVLGAEPIQGRTFNADDTNPDARTVIVNESFVTKVLGGRNPIGRRLRYLASYDDWDGVELGDEPGPWYRIVGVMADLGISARAGFFHAVSPGSLLASGILVHVKGDPSTFAPRLREIATEVDPDLAIVALRPLDALKDSKVREYAYWVWLITGVSSLALLLSLAGIYSVMSFTVSRRKREIGVRVAMGAKSAQVAGAIFRRPLKQIAAGLLVGFWICVTLGWGPDADGLWGKPLIVLLGYSAGMTAVCLLACLGPIREALAVEPSEALAADG